MGLSFSSSFFIFYFLGFYGFVFFGTSYSPFFSFPNLLLLFFILKEYESKFIQNMFFIFSFFFLVK